MAFTPVEIVPGMDINTAYAVINNNFRMLTAENRTKIMTSDEGVKRVIIGKPPVGDYLVAITVKDKDVIEELDTSGKPR